MIDVQEAKPEMVPLVGEGEFFVRVTTSPILAPGAIGPYSQAMRAGKLLNLNRQLPIDSKTGKLVSGQFKDRVRQVMKNLSTICEMTDSKLSRVVKLNISLLSFDNDNFEAVNEVMKEFFHEPYPARSTTIVPDLPKGADIGIDALLVLS
jgi:2-iminobutanoate/2-iminopropanoate deaminase